MSQVTIQDTSVAMLVAIDGGVKTPELLASGVQPGATVLRLEANTDAMVQITAVLSSGKYDSVHIVSHGTSGCIQLGAQRLTTESLKQYRQMVMEWGVKEIWVYGCEVAAEPEVLVLLHQWSGAAIVASSQRVGQGHWEMDHRIGQPTSMLAFSAELQRQYQGQFAPTYTQSTVVVGLEPTSVAIGDLNGDGKADDIVVANSGSDNVSILIGDGSGGFSQSTVAVGTKPSSVAIGDFDGDGNADDIAVAKTFNQHCFGVD